MRSSIKQVLNLLNPATFHQESHDFNSTTLQSMLQTQARPFERQICLQTDINP